MGMVFSCVVQTQAGPVLSGHRAAIGATVLEALQQCGMAVPPTYKVGVWGRSIKPGQLLQAGDRVELYLPLLADPKDARRARVNRSIVQQATKENAANRALNRAHRLRREAAKQTQAITVHPEPVEGLRQ